MATTLEYIEYVAAQAVDCGNVRYRKMFGEYMVYVNDKPILLVCDNTVYVKILPCLGKLMVNAKASRMTGRRSIISSISTALN